MKIFVVAFLFCFTLTLSGSAESAEATYRVAAFGPGIKYALKKNASWKTCGDYFAAVETAGGKRIYFTYEQGPLDNLSLMFAFPMIERVAVLKRKAMTAPTVTVIDNRLDTQFVLTMNVKDYKVGLPCLTKTTTDA